MFKPTLFHELTLNFWYWLLAIAVITTIVVIFAATNYKRTAVFWKKVDLIWIILALFGASTLVYDNNNVITPRFIKTETESLESQKNHLLQRNKTNEYTYHCSSKVEVCNYLKNINKFTIININTERKIDISTLPEPNLGRFSLSTFDKSILEELHSSFVTDVQEFNARLDVVESWKKLNNSAGVNPEALKFMGSIFFIFAFAMRIGKSIADLLVEIDKQKSTQENVPEEEQKNDTEVVKL